MSALATVLLSVVVLKGATVHPASSPAIADGIVVMDGARILAVGGPETAVPAGATVVDVSGKHIAPAYFAPATALGLVEIEAVRATLDITETGDLNPEVRPDVAMNLDSVLLPVARSGGVLFGALVPRGSVLPGHVSVVRLDGWTREDACVSCPAASVLEWPDMRIDRSKDARPSAKRQEKRREEALDRIRDAFRGAQAYRLGRNQKTPQADVDARFASLVPVLEGKSLLLVRANTKQQIEAVLRFLDDDLAKLMTGPPNVALLGGDDAPLLAARLAERKIAVILDGVLELPARSDDAYDTPFTRAALLSKAGVLVAVSAGAATGAASLTQNLAHHAAQAAAFGLSREEALRSITLNGARIFGVEKELGSLETGKEASLVVLTGDPLEVTSQVTALYHRGVSIDLGDKQKSLYEKYRNRPRPTKR